MVTIKYYGEIHASNAINPEQWPGRNKDRGSSPRAMAILLYGSWNVRIASANRGDDVPWAGFVEDALGRAGAAPPNVECAAASVRVDADDESLAACTNAESGGGLGAPPALPALLFLASAGDGHRPRVERVRFNGGALDALLTRSNLSARKDLVSSIGDAWARLFDDRGNLLPPRPKARGNVVGGGNGNKRRKIAEPATRIFVAGDRSQVGKSSICMGLLGSLLNSGRYAPSDLAYIKPATQCEKTQLVEEFCKSKGIQACVPVGPIVYYKGFTRAFLKGETGETSGKLLRKASNAVDELAEGKAVVIIDGVGYPAVGSITGTDNASVAKACGRPLAVPKSDNNATAERSPVPVLLVGKSGVGDAVDSFNINATYFAHRSVPVIGAVFNKLSLDGFYSLSNCQEAIEMYFRKFQQDRTAFGFIPEMPSLKNAREEVENNRTEEEEMKRALETADLFVEEFSKRVNVDRILKAAKDATAKFTMEEPPQVSTCAASGSKRPAGEMERPAGHLSNAAKMTEHSRPVDAIPEQDKKSLTREQIEAVASAAGAAGA